jgi:hypothetical protein
MPLRALRCSPGIGSSGPLGHEQMACGFSGKRDAHPTWLRWQPSGPSATTLAPTVTFSRLPVNRVQSLGQHRARHAVHPP